MIPLTIQRPQRTEEVVKIEFDAPNSTSESWALRWNSDVDALSEPRVTMANSVAMPPNNTVLLQVIPSEWNKSLGHEFDNLALKEVDENITPDERRRLERLSDIRRHLHHPRTPEEIIYEEDRNELLSDIVFALGKYVTFLNVGSTNHSRPRP